MKYCNYLKFIVLLSIASTNAYSSNGDGNSLIKSCIIAEDFLNNERSSNFESTAYCFAIVKGVMGTLYLFEGSLPYKYKACFPNTGANFQQGVRIVTKYLKDNPDKLSHKENTLIVMALLEAFPCKKQ